MIPLTILAIAILIVYLAKRTLTPLASNPHVRRAIKCHYINGVLIALIGAYPSPHPVYILFAIGLGIYALWKARAMVSRVKSDEEKSRQVKMGCISNIGCPLDLDCSQMGIDKYGGCDNWIVCRDLRAFMRSHS
jgi:hypothetical protein